MNVSESIKKAREYIDNLTVNSAVNIPAEILEEGGFFTWDNERRAFPDQPYLFQWSYYNGVVFKGYVKGVPRAVLSGGRYDHLMRRFEKPQAAVGFALYLSELNRLFQEEREYDVDTLLLYDGQSLSGPVAAAVRTLSAQGSIFAASSPPEGLRARRTVHLRGTAFLQEQPAENPQETAREMMQDAAPDTVRKTVENIAQKTAQEKGGDGTC